jgi:hypothetical protein
MPSFISMMSEKVTPGENKTVAVVDDEESGGGVEGGESREMVEDISCEHKMLTYSLFDILKKDHCPDYAAFKLTHGSHLLLFLMCVAQASAYAYITEYIRVLLQEFLCL